MHFNYFMEHLQGRFQLSPIYQQELKSRVKVMAVYKGQDLHFPGEICKYVYFIHSGFFRNYILHDEQEETIDFAGQDKFITSAVSFLNQVNTKEGIICVIPGIVIRINLYDWLALEDISPDFLRLGHIIMQEYLLHSHHEKNLFRTANANEKYEYLCQQFPAIKNMVSGKDIASYLGITQPTFSNLLKNRLRKT